MTYEFKLSVKERKEWKVYPVTDSKPIIFLHKIPIQNTKKFWDGLKKGKIYATKCKKCGKIYFPPQNFCTSCYTYDVEWIELKGEGVLETYTKVIIKPYGFTDYDDYTIGIAKLNEGIRVLAWVINCEENRLKIGEKVKLIAKKINDEHIYVISCI